ncbi:hypothetical protein LCGC14_0273620 [marine sediment metagenome]|uniref:Methyltransferase domain-containing protein n=1 Tax=marine sediment metagenome TaxID=412755 RepID=A0A0F9TY49_9ZZZZ
MTEQKKIEARARRENAADLWDRLWSEPESRDWREVALGKVYNRIISYVPKGASVIDFGGGVGAFGARLTAARDNAVDVLVLDHSRAAIDIARGKGLRADYVDLEDHNSVLDAVIDGTNEGELDPIWIATEVLEHLSVEGRARLLEHISCYRDDAPGFFTVPNNCLGPEVEPQHTIQFTAMSFTRELREHFDHVRVEVLGPYLLGIVGDPAKTTASVSMCLPVRDEEADLEAVLASFRGFVREIVVGVDPRTVDRTREIAALYADVVFELEDPTCSDTTNPLHDPAVPETGCHFSWLRNQCIERCSSEWVFMTEGHERLWQGHDVLLGVGELLKEADVAYVWRRGKHQRWLFPWLARRDLRYKRSTHNIVDIPEDARRALMRDIVTFHDRDHGNAEKRSVQRKEQNKKTLWDDWNLHGNPTSLFYFAQELKPDDPEGAVEHFEDFLSCTESPAGQMRYQARLILAKLYLQLSGEDSEDGHDVLASQRLDRCAEVLHGCSAEDWSRTEHWLWLGDLAFARDQFEMAYRFYGYSGLSAGTMPATVWWVDDATYLWLPAQRLAMTCGLLGREAEALVWARRVERLLPADASVECIEEAARNVEVIEEFIAARKDQRNPVAEPVA